MSSHSRQSSEHGESPLAAEKWQLRILWELHKKHPRPTVKQRRLLAAETGLDVKWIARWFKRANSTSKRKRQSTVGCPPSKSQTATATKSIDNTVKPANLAEPTASGTSTSPSLFSAASGHRTFLSSRSGVVPESGRSVTGPFRNTHPQSWELELEHPAVVPNLQANREYPIFYPHAQGASHPAAALPQPHPDLVEHPQQTLGILTSPVYLASPLRRGTGTSSTTGSAGMDVQSSIKSSGPHTSSSTGPLQTRYVHLNLVSRSFDKAYTEFGPLQRDLGPAAADAACTGAQVDVSIPDLVAPQLGPSSAPLPSIYWFLFDLDRDSVDQQRDVLSRSSSRPLLGRILTPHVTPTPVSFSAKWEDMLALERRNRSSSHKMKSVQSKQTQVVHPVEANNRTKRGSRGGVTMTETDRDH